MSLKTTLKRSGHIFLAIVLACAAGLIIYYYIQVNVPSQKVIVAASKIPVGTTIAPGMVKYDVYPRAKLPPDVTVQQEDVVGKTVTVGLLENSLVRKANLTAGKGGLNVLLATMATGREAVDLPPETAPGLNGVSIGDQVDLYTETGVVDPSGKAVSSKVDDVAKSAIILATPTSNDGKQPGPAGQKGSYVVAVKPEEAQQVADGIVKGKKFSVFLLPAKGGQQ